MEYHALLLCQHSQITFSGIHSEVTDIFLIAGPQTMISCVAIRTDGCKRLDCQKWLRMNKIITMAALIPTKIR